MSFARRRRPCIAPAEISGESLVAASRGEANPTTTTHVRRCARCADRVAQFKRLDRLVHTALDRRSCPSSLALAEHVLDLLAVDEAERVSTHLLECARCASERAILLADTRASLLQPPAAAGGVSEAATAQFDRRATAGAAPLIVPPTPEPPRPPVERAGTLIDSLARLVTESMRPLATQAGGLRGDASDESTSYEAGDLQVTVSAERSGSDSVITGIVIGGQTTESGGSVTLYQAERLIQTTPIDEFGSFGLEQVAAGNYRLELRLAETLISIDPFRVG